MPINYLYNLATDKQKGFVAAIFKFFLFLLSLVYGVIIRGCILFSRLIKRRLNLKVISVGNITLGGTGKTSLVEFISRFLREKGIKVAVLSRGYKGDQETADEPMMLKNNLLDIPVIVDKNRIRGTLRAIGEFNAEGVILDDGFQQWGLVKDLEIVAIDATRPFGNRHMLPRGILREPLTSLKRAHVFVLTKTNLSPETEGLKIFLHKLNPGALIVESMHSPVCFYNLSNPKEEISLPALKDETVTLFCGIGDPDSFCALIKLLGVKVGSFLPFTDHYKYTAEDLDRIVRESKKMNIGTIITTQKDAARLHEIRDTRYETRFLVLRIKLEIKDESTFIHRLLSLYTA